jgi:hypothetical protein
LQARKAANFHSQKARYALENAGRRARTAGAAALGCGELCHYRLQNM